MTAPIKIQTTDVPTAAARRSYASAPRPRRYPVSDGTPVEVVEDMTDGTVWVPASSSGAGVLAGLASPGTRVTVKGAGA